MTRILGTTNSGNEVQLEFGNVPFLQRAELASKIVNEKPQTYYFVWGKTLAESSILTPEYSKDPESLWSLSDETIDNILTHMAERFPIQNFLKIILGDEYTPPNIKTK